MATDRLVMEPGVGSASGKFGASFRDYLSVTKLGITFANLMATFAGLWVGSHGHPTWTATVFTLLGTALVVMSGASFNNYIDRDIDDKMERTKTRAVVSGKVNPTVVLWMAIILGVAGLAILTLAVNVPAAICGLVGLVVYAYVYTVWLKRTTTLSTVLGGVAGAMPPLVGWAGGSGGSLGFAAWVVFIVFMLWQPPHFLPLAMKKSEEYRAAGIPMLPVVEGFQPTKWQIVRYTAAMLPVSLLLYGLHYEGVLYLIGATVLGLIFLIQALRGLFTKNDLVWASSLFRYSLIYLTAMCVLMVVGVV